MKPLGVPGRTTPFRLDKELIRAILSYYSRFKNLERLYKFISKFFPLYREKYLKFFPIDNKEISNIIIGDLKGIRNNHKNSKTNSIINNFWSYKYIVQRLKEKAEEYGIEIKEVSEYKTSSICPFCGSKGIREYRGLFYCPRCEKVMNSDVVGVLNIAKRNRTIIPSPSWDRDNGLVAQPLFLRWDGCRWKPKRAMNTQRMSTLETRIPLIN